MSNRVFNQARARKVGGGLLVMAEFELFNTAGVNIALLGTATATSSGWGGEPEYAIDGSSDNTIASCHHSTGSVDETWTLTMDRSYAQSELSSVGFLGRNVGSNHDSVALELLSTDGGSPLVLGTTVNVSYQTFDVPEIVAVSVLNIVPGPVFVNISWSVIDNALSYKVEVDNGYTVTTESLELLITDLIPETLYSFSVYYTLNGNDFILTETKTETTLENSASNYTASDFLENGIYDFGDLDPQYLTNDILETIVSNNSRIVVPVDSEEITGTVLVSGGTIDIPDDAIVSTIDSSGSSGEIGTIVLSDSTNTSLEVLEDTSQVIVNGVTHNDGDSFALDGKRAIVKFI